MGHIGERMRAVGGYAYVNRLSESKDTSIFEIIRCVSLLPCSGFAVLLLCVCAGLQGYRDVMVADKKGNDFGGVWVCI